MVLMYGNPKTMFGSVMGALRLLHDKFKLSQLAVIYIFVCFFEYFSIIRFEFSRLLLTAAIFFPP